MDTSNLSTQIIQVVVWSTEYSVCINIRRDSGRMVAQSSANPLWEGATVPYLTVLRNCEYHILPVSS
jgi:hypothetical protein